MKVSAALRSTIAQTIISGIAAGTGTPKLEIYSGAMPASMGLAISDDLLSEHQLDGQVATESSGVITFLPIADDPSVNADGTAGWARVLDGDNNEVIYLTVSATGAGGELELNTVNLQAGSGLSITSGTITVGG